MAQRKYPSFVKQWINNMKTAFIQRGADPNEVVTKDLLDYNQNRGVSATNKNLSVTSNKILGKLLSIFNTHIAGKQEVLAQSRELFDTDVVQTIIDVVINDAFNSFVNIEDEFKIEFDPDDENISQEFKEQVQSKIDDLVDRFDLKNQIADIVPELLRDGEFAFGIVLEPGEGIKDIVDDLDVANLLPFYNGNKLAFIMKQPECDQMNGRPLVYRAENVIYFRLKYFNKQRVDLRIDGSLTNDQLRKKFYEETKLYLPRFLRICKPFYYSALKLIARLGVLELVGTVQELNQVTRRDIINLNVPQNTTPREASAIVNDYEKILNGPDNDLDSDRLDVATLTNYNTKRIILPQWSDGKGTLSLSDVNSGTNDRSAGTRDSISFVRSLIALSVGVPGFYVSLSEQALDKTQTLKLYTRYVRKLSSLQKSIADGCVDFVQADLKACNIFVEDKSIKVRFKTLTSADSLDETDITVGTIEGLNNIFKNLVEIEDAKPDLKVSSEVFKKIFDTQTRKYLGFTDLLQYIENVKPSDEFEGENDDVDDDDADFESDYSSTSDAYDNFANSPVNDGDDNFEPVEVETDIGPEATPNEENNIENAEGE